MLASPPLPGGGIHPTEFKYTPKVVLKTDKNQNIERLSQVIERRAVYLLSSWDSAIYLHFLKGYNSVIAEEKFKFNFMSYMISKKHKFAKIIKIRNSLNIFIIERKILIIFFFNI